MPPKNKKGGKKHRRGKKAPLEENTKVIYKSDEQEYAIVEKVLGSCRFSLKCSDGIPRLGILRGTMRKRKWVKADDYVLVSMRDFEPKKCDIIHVYPQYHRNKIKRFIVIDDSDDINKVKEEDTGFVFDEDYVVPYKKDEKTIVDEIKKDMSISSPSSEEINLDDI
jgi:initiation factor 1A